MTRKSFVFVALLTLGLAGLLIAASMNRAGAKPAVE
jgi:hypothetical protein